MFTNKSFQHGAVHYHAATWSDGWKPMNGTTMGLKISSRYLCAFKMPSIQCTCVRLFITHACPYHNPTATMGHSIHNVDISKPLTHTTRYTLSAICPLQWKPGFIREEKTSPKCQTPSNVSMCPLKSVTVTNWPRWGWRACRWASMRRFLTVCAEIIW